MNALCSHCDVFIGFGGAGVVVKPENKSNEWLMAHCWICGCKAGDDRATCGKYHTAVTQER